MVVANRPLHYRKMKQPAYVALTFMLALGLPATALADAPEVPDVPSPNQLPTAAALPATGVSFRVSQRLTLRTSVAAANDGSDSADNSAQQPDVTAIRDVVTISPCELVTINLKRGNLRASNSSEDALLSFSDLTPGPYTYEVECRSREHGAGSVKGTVEIAANSMVEIPITVDISGRDRSNDNVFSGSMGEVISISSGSPDQKGGDLDSKTRDLTILANLGYVTSRETHQGIAPLAFTDLGVWSIAAAFTPERRLTFGGKVAGLAKSPATLDARVIQNAGATLSYAFGRHLAASAGGQWQAGWDTTRSVINAGGGITWRKQHAEFVKTEFSVGAEGVMHRGAALDGNRTSTFATGTAEVQLCWNSCDRRYGASWFGFDAAIPLTHSNDAANLVGAKPNSALGFHVGSFMRVNDSFDLFADVAWHDRGDAAAIKTEFGTLLGGFDQIQLSLGAIFYFHFGKAKQRNSSDYVRAL